MNQPTPDEVPSQPVVGTRNSPLAHVEAAAGQALIAVLARLPRPMLEGFKTCLAHVARAVDKRHAASARDFIRQAFKAYGREESPKQVERRVLDAYRHLVEIALTPARFQRRFGGSQQALMERTELQISDPVRKLLEGGGCVVVSAHVGDWEMAAQIMAAAGFNPFYIISKPPRNRPMSLRAQAQRERGGVRLLPRRGSMGFAPRVIASGGYLGMLLDQRARVKPVLAPFFGRPARCDRTAGVLMKRLKCPVVFITAYRTGDLRWRFEAKTALLADEVRGLSPLEIASLVNQELEQQIMAVPEQQFWLHDRFRDTPLTFEEADLEAGGGAS